MKKIVLMISCVLLSATLCAQKKVTMLFAGDAMGHIPQYQWAYNSQTDSYDYEPCFRYIKHYVSAADIAVVNVEVTYGGAPYSGYPNFSTPDEYHSALLDAGFDIMLLANNHILDRGKNGLERTLDVIGSTPNLGAYKDSLDRVRRYPMVIKINGLRIALFNSTYGCNGYVATPPNIVNLNDTALILKDLEAIKDRDIDLRIMCVHWGAEYVLKAGTRQQELAKWLHSKGFDLIIGGHPHVVQNAEMIGDMPVFYSLGNLVSNQRDEHKNGGVMVRVEIDVLSRKISKVEYIPYYVHRGEITYQKDGEMITERQFFLLPTKDYLNDRLPFKLNQNDEAALKRFDTNTKKRLSNFDVAH